METVNIYTGQPQQTFDCWGTSLCWWANAAGGWTMKNAAGEEKREELMRLFFTEEGLNLNIVRYNIGGGDNPDEARHMFHFRGLPCFRAAPGAEFDKTADARQLWVLKRAQELQGERLVTEAFVNSPPWWMTNSLCSAGGEKGSDENLPRARYGEFAAFCAEALAYLEQGVGVKVDYFDPMNEPASDFWAKGQRQEGNRVAAGESQSRLLAAAYEALKARGLRIGITGTDETNPMEAVHSFNALDARAKDEILAKINYHRYASQDEALARLCEIAYPQGFAAPRYKLWMDEVCYGDGPDSMAGLGKRLVDAIHDDLNIAHAGGWVIWQAMDTMSENIRDNCHWGLVEGMYQDKNNNELAGVLDVAAMGYDYGDTVITTQYYVMGHYSKFIKPGYRIVPSDGAAHRCVAAVSPEGDEVVAVLYNDGEEAKTLALNLDGFAPAQGTKLHSGDDVKWSRAALHGDITRVTLPPQSIVTLTYRR